MMWKTKPTLRNCEGKECNRHMNEYMFREKKFKDDRKGR